MTGASSETGSRGSGAACAGVGAGDAVATGGAAGAEAATDDGGAGVTDGGAVPAGCGAPTGGRSSVAPHMPQNRLVPGLSLPQRAQRTNPPDLFPIAYDILRVGCSAKPKGVPAK